MRFAGAAAAGGGGGAAAAQQLQQQRRYTSWRDAAARIVREEGAAALAKGIRQRTTQISLGGAIFLGSYEEYKRQLAGVSLAE